MELKTIVEWEKVYDTFIMDADGFPEDTDRTVTYFTENDFIDYCKRSTIRFSEKIIKAMKI